MFCEQCGAVVPDGMKFCDQCGAPVSDGEAQSTMLEPGQYNTQSGPVNNVVPPVQQGVAQPGGTQPPYMQQGRIPAMSPGAMSPGAYNTQKKPPLVPIIIAVVAVLVLGLGGFGIYKNIDKIKGLVGKVKDNEEQSEEIPTENENPDDDKSGNESIKESLDEEFPDSENADRVKPDDNIKEDNTKEDKTEEGRTGENEIEEDITEKDKTGKEWPDEKENRPDIGDVRDYDSSGDPAWSDFEWVMSDEMTQGLLSGEDMFSDSAYRLTDYEDVIGGWKGYLCYDPNNTYADNPWGGPMVFLVHAEISGDMSEPSIYFEWLQYRKTADGEEGKLTSKETFACNRRSNNVFNGRAGSGWHITLEHFCWLDGKEYATGRMKAADGGDCILALFRP